MKCVVNVMWDDEVKVWHCKSEDIPGLVLESHSYELLLDEYKNEARDFLKVNRNYIGPFYLSFE